MSEAYQVTARKWRPQRFDEVVGQDHVTTTIKNAIRENRLAHAYLFTGQRGCGKTTVARILAKAINCPNGEKNGYEPCNTCEICRSITAGTSMDVSEIDGASNNGVDDVRAMRDNIKYPPLNGKYRVVIIDEVHMLSTPAFNALLKTLEEPPPHLVFIFATTEVQKILPTILSRTQRYDFRRMQIDEIIQRLQLISTSDKITADEDALLLIARKADGSMRDAQSIFDQAVAFTGGTLDAPKLREALSLIDADFYFDVSDAIIKSETSKAFSLASEVVLRGYSIEEFLSGLLDHFRNFMTVIVTKEPSLLETTKATQERYMSDAGHFSEGDLLRLVKIGFRAIDQLKSAPSPRMVLELAIVEMTLLERSVDIRSLLDELEKLKGGAVGLPKSNGTKNSAASAPSLSSTISEAAPKTSPRSVGNLSADTPVNAPSEQSAAPTGSVAEHWDEFKAHLAQKSVPFMMVVDDVELAGVDRKTVRLRVSKNHTVETFARNKETFAAALRTYFGIADLIIEAIKVERSVQDVPRGTPSPAVNGSRKAHIADAPKYDDGVERTPLELELMDRMGAVPV